MRLPKAFALAAMLWPALGLGQAAEPSAAGEDNEPVATESYEAVVTTRLAVDERLDAERSIEVIDRQRLERMQPRTLPDALREADGVYVQETNVGAGAPIIRGLVGPQNLLLIDGVRFNTATFRTGPSQYLALVDPLAVRRIEVVRGPSSVLFGNGAMGGVVNVLTRKPPVTRGNRGELGGRGASADRGRSGWLRLEKRAGGLGMYAGGSIADHDALRSGDGSHSPLSGYQRRAWSVKAALGRPVAPGQLTFTYLGGALRNAGRSDRLGRGDLRIYDTDDHFAYAAYRLSSEGFVRRLEAHLSLHQLSELVNRRRCATDTVGVVIDRSACLRGAGSDVTHRSRHRDAVTALGADVTVEMVALDERLQVVAGAEAYRDTVASSASDATATGWTARERGNFSPGSDYTTLGLFLRGNGRIVDVGHAGTLHANLGGRLSGFGARADAVPGVGDVRYSYAGIVGAAGLRLTRARSHTLYVSFLQGFRAPNLQETTVLGDSGSKFEVPNPDLRPERSDTIEVGGRVHVGPVTGSAAAFRSYLSDAIDERPATWNGENTVDGAPVVARTNIAGGVIDGIEASVSVHLLSWIQLDGGITWLHGRGRDADGSELPLRRIPPLLGRAALKLTPPVDGLYIEAMLQAAARQSRLHPSDAADLRICETSRYSGQLQQDCDGTAGWVSLGARAGMQLAQGLHADLALTNMTDSRYRLHGSGVDAPGFDARLTMRYRF